jgi:type I restriction enzyme S subunit
MQDGQSGLLPKLRFPEFRGKSAWEERHGDVLFDQINERNADRSLPVLAITQEHGAIPRDMIDYHVSVTEKSIESYKVVRVGDFIISLRSFQGGIEYSQYNGICSPAYVVLRRRNEGSNEYFKHYLKFDPFIRILTRNLEGLRDGKMISYKQFSDLLIPTPTPDEQRKIASCLSTLDELIGVQGRKVAALRTHKKGLMQQLFPREGETQPRLRFPEFKKEGTWKRRKIGEMLMETQRPIALSDTTEYRLVTVKRRYGGLVLREILNGRQILVKSQFMVSTGDFLISKRQIVHNACGLVTQELDGAVVSNEYSVLSPKPECSIEFFSWFSMQPVVSKSFMDCSVGIVIEKMLFKLPAWLKQEFLFPSFLEQQRIASCLSSLDEFITAETQRLEALKTHKRGLMQQLFPSPEAT